MGLLVMDGLLLRKCIVEFIGTFFLVFVIGCVSSQAHALLGPLAIGVALMVMIFAGGHVSGGQAVAVGAISGGAFNPAVVVGAFMMRGLKAGSLWTYWLSHLIAAVVAAGAFRFLQMEVSVPDRGPGAELQELSK
jgi:aquaporin Z